MAALARSFLTLRPFLSSGAFKAAETCTLRASQNIMTPLCAGCIHISPSKTIFSSAKSFAKKTPNGDEGAKLFSTSPATIPSSDGQDYEVIQNINDQITLNNTGRIFAIVQIGGAQRKITQEDILVVKSHYPVDIGEKIRINKVLMVGSKDFSLVGRPILNANTVRVEATVLEKTLTEIRLHFDYKTRSRKIKKLRPFQEQITLLRINSIEVNPTDES